MNSVLGIVVFVNVCFMNNLIQIFLQLLQLTNNKMKINLLKSINQIVMKLICRPQFY